MLLQLHACKYLFGNVFNWSAPPPKKSLLLPLLTDFHPLYISPAYWLVPNVFGKSTTFYDNIYACLWHKHTHKHRAYNWGHFLPSFRSFGRNSREHTRTHGAGTHGRKKVLGLGTSRPPTYIYHATRTTGNTRASARARPSFDHRSGCLLHHDTWPDYENFTTHTNT